MECLLSSWDGWGGPSHRRPGIERRCPGGARHHASGLGASSMTPAIQEPFHALNVRPIRPGWSTHCLVSYSGFLVGWSALAKFSCILFSVELSLHRRRMHHFTRHWTVQEGQKDVIQTKKLTQSQSILDPSPPLPSDCCSYWLIDYYLLQFDYWYSRSTYAFFLWI